MARRNQAEFCIVCSESPCKCNKTVQPRKVLPPKLPAAMVPVKIEQPKRAGLSAIKKVAHPTRPHQVSSRVASLPKVDTDQTDMEMARAVTIIVQAGLLGATEIEKHRKLILITDTEIRAILWRQRNEGKTHGAG